LQTAHVRRKFFARGQVDTGATRGTAHVFCCFLELNPRFFQISLQQASPQSGLRPEMSLEFEYRRLAAACLDLAKRAAPADKTRLLLIAEAWLNLADRVARKVRLWSQAPPALARDGSNNSASASRHVGTADGSTPACS
jgi:hypothetical protein